MSSAAWWKFLGPGAVAPFSGHVWSPPSAEGPGAWVTSDGQPSSCRRGLHLCRTRDLPFWLGEELYAAEVEGDVVEGRSFVIATRARLAERVTAWRRDAAAAFGRECAWATRGVVVRLLRTTGRGAAAEELESATTLPDVAATADQVAVHAPGEVVDQLGFLADAARFAEQITVEDRWASRAATVALVAATAAARAPEPGSSWSGERARQAAWLATEVLGPS